MGEIKGRGTMSIELFFQMRKMNKKIDEQNELIRQQIYLLKELKDSIKTANR